jgi:hypothetical protein
MAYNTESAIDLSLTTPEYAPDLDWFVSDELNDSDHYPIIMRFQNALPGDSKRPRWILNSANWDKYRKNVDDDLEVKTVAPDIQSITQTILNSASMSIKRSKTTITKKTLKWMTPEIQNFIRERRKAERRMKRQNTPENVIEFKRLKAKVRWQIKNARRKAWEEYTSTLTNQTPTQQIWRKIGKIKGRLSSSGIRQIQDPISQTTTRNAKEIANLLAENFARNSSTENYDPRFLKIQREKEDIKINMNHKADYNSDLTE